MQLDKQLPPSNLSAENSSNAKRKTDSNQTSTNTFSFGANTVNTGKIQVETKPQNNGGQSESHYDWPVAVVTLLLVVVTVYLVRYTKKLWGATICLAKDAKSTSNRQANEMQESLSNAKANTALAREEFISTHRQRLIVRGVRIKEIPTEGFSDPTVTAEFTVANTGDTGAVITDFTGKLWHEQMSDTLEEFPSMSSYGPIKNVSISLNGGESVSLVGTDGTL